MAAEAPVSGAWLVLAALVGATLLALIAYTVARYLLGADLDFLSTLLTAVVVGGFFSLFLARPGQKRTTFDVEGETVVEADEEEREKPPQ